MENINFTFWTVENIATMFTALLLGWKATEEDTRKLNEYELGETDYEDALGEVPVEAPVQLKFSRERFVVMQDKDIKNPKHPYAPRVWMRANDAINAYGTTTGDNPVAKSIDEQLDDNIPCKLMRLQAPDKMFYSTAKSLPAHVQLYLRETEHRRHAIVRFMKQNKGDSKMLLKGLRRFEKLVSQRKIRKAHIKDLRSLFGKLIKQARKQ